MRTSRKVLGTGGAVAVAVAVAAVVNVWLVTLTKTCPTHKHSQHSHTHSLSLSLSPHLTGAYLVLFAVHCDYFCRVLLEVRLLRKIGRVLANQHQAI